MVAMMISAFVVVDVFWGINKSGYEYSMAWLPTKEVSLDNGLCVVEAQMT